MAPAPTIPAFLMLLLLFSCGATDGAVDDGAATNQTPVDPTPDENGTPPVVDEPVDTLWSRVTKTMIEDACLKEAKKYAVSQGYPESAVFYCRCQSDEREDSKTYDCDVRALDGNHDIIVACTRAELACAITTEAGTQKIDLENLEGFVAE